MIFWRRLREVRLETEVQSLQLQLDELRGDRDYWRTRCERLLDNALARKGEAAGPVMQPHAPPQERTLGSIFSPLAVTEIESGKRRGGPVDGIRGHGLFDRSDQGEAGQEPAATLPR